MKRVLAELEQILRGPAGGLRAEHTRRSIARLVGITVLCGLLYGGVMGTFGGFSGDRAWQVLISAVKVPLLLLTTFALSLPSFFVLNTLLGVRSDFAGSWGARAWLGLPGIVEGGLADLVVYETDPRADLRVLRTPSRIVLRGRVVR